MKISPEKHKYQEGRYNKTTKGLLPSAYDPFFLHRSKKVYKSKTNSPTKGEGRKGEMIPTVEDFIFADMEGGLRLPRVRTEIYEPIFTNVALVRADGFISPLKLAQIRPDGFIRPYITVHVQVGRERQAEKGRGNGLKQEGGRGEKVKRRGEYKN
jgi:hypothetical protein